MSILAIIVIGILCVWWYRASERWKARQQFELEESYRRHVEHCNKHYGGTDVRWH